MENIVLLSQFFTVFVYFMFHKNGCFNVKVSSCEGYLCNSVLMFLFWIVWFSVLSVYCGVFFNFCLEIHMWYASAVDIEERSFLRWINFVDTPSICCWFVKRTNVCFFNGFAVLNPVFNPSMTKIYFWLA